jgi:predicted transcriptional regulator
VEPLLESEKQGDWRETQFSPEQWACVPTTASPWHSAPAPLDVDDRLRTAGEIGAVLHAIIIKDLTFRQRQVVELYYFENRTQEEVATALGISQATVSQHLKGKRRRGNYVGGAFRKIRKAIRKAAARKVGDKGRYAEIITAFDVLLETSITHLRAHKTMEALIHKSP